jgi:RNA polymerase sigma factor for flagellar operon FliA
VIKRLPSYIDLDDLIHIGTLGLIEAIDRFNPEKIPSFNAYARMRIQGAIYDQLRQHDWVPRSVRDRAKQIRQAKLELTKSLRRKPDESEIAVSLGVSLERYQTMLKRSDIRHVLSMEEGAEDNQRIGDLIADEKADPLKHTLMIEQEEILHAIIETLPEREQQIITMYYFKEKTFKEISQGLGLTESRISQIHTEIKKTLLSRIKERA